MQVNDGVYQVFIIWLIGLFREYALSTLLKEFIYCNNFSFPIYDICSYDFFPLFVEDFSYSHIFQKTDLSNTLYHQYAIEPTGLKSRNIMISISHVLTSHLAQLMHCFSGFTMQHSVSYTLTLVGNATVDGQTLSSPTGVQ